MPDGIGGFNVMNSDEGMDHISSNGAGGFYMFNI